MGQGEAVAWIDTDPDLQVLEAVKWIVDNDVPVDELKALCAPEVVAMHTANGLWDDIACADDALTRRTRIDDELAALLVSHERPMLGGRNPAFDRAWMERWLPKSAAELHYRHIDETGLKWLFKGAGIDVGQSSDAHRAEKDISECLYRVKSYRERLTRLALAGSTD